MIRYSFFVLAVVITAASAIAAVAPSSSDFRPGGANVTVIEKNQAFPVHGPLSFEDCVTDDCGEARI